MLIAKNGLASYYCYMDVLEKLESRIDDLLARLDALNTENVRLHEQLAAQAQDVEHLADNNKALRGALEKEMRLREEALARIDALLFKIREHDSVG